MEGFCSHKHNSVCVYVYHSLFLFLKHPTIPILRFFSSFLGVKFDCLFANSLVTDDLCVRVCCSDYEHFCMNFWRCSILEGHICFQVFRVSFLPSPSSPLTFYSCWFPLPKCKNRKQYWISLTAPSLCVIVAMFCTAIHIVYFKLQLTLFLT